MTGWMDKGDQVIVMLDANVDLATNEDGFKERLEDIILKELIMSQHPDLTPPPTRTPGKKTRRNIWHTCTGH